MAKPGTYVYCLIAADRRPPLRRRAPRLPGMGPVRLIAAAEHLWLAVADAPLNRYGEETINRKLSDLDWVSRAAIAHESVVESFIDQRAVLPMKLFTIFTSDDRAIEEVSGDRRRVDAIVKRVANQIEWGVRVTLLRPNANPKLRQGSASPKTTSGLSYLSRKKAQRDASVELAERARENVSELYDRLSRRSRLAKRRSASEMPVDGGPLLLDAAFLVPRARATSFRELVAREARRLGPLGYQVAVTGPWPPYTFVKD